MKRAPGTKPVSWLLVASLLAPSVPNPVHAQTAAPADTVAASPADSAAALPALAPDSGTGSPLEQARELLSDGDYDRAIEVLKPALAHSAGDVERQRATYLLLIKTYVFIGNDLKFKPQGRESSNLNYQEARRLIAECLGVRELRHTEPRPASQYPPEMVAFFAEARRTLFGAFLVREVEPASAVILFDGDTLRAMPDGGEGEALAGDVDIPIGDHVVIVRAPGFKETTDHITIPPDVTLERSYRLTKKRGAMWYASYGVGALALVGGVIAAVAGGGAAEKTEPLPSVPDPPPAP